MSLITESYLELIPAYGRDYKNKAQVEADFRMGKDFENTAITRSGKYCAIGDFAKGTTVLLRYSKLMKVHVVKV